MHVLRRRRLALELHHQRVLAGLTGSEVAARMDCSASKISRIETGRVPIAPRDARELARIYGLAPDRQEQLAQLARDARRTGWWEAYGDLLKPEQVWFLGLESAAARLRIFEVGVIPGLLQTTDYARAIIDAALLGLPGPELSRLVQITGSRQSVLTRRSPAIVAAVVDEAVPQPGWLCHSDQLHRGWPAGLIGSGQVPDEEPHGAVQLERRNLAVATGIGVQRLLGGSERAEQG
jgi:transcriptional regulator with XRE-family HTH domain